MDLSEKTNSELYEYQQQLLEEAQKLAPKNEAEATAEALMDAMSGSGSQRRSNLLNEMQRISIVLLGRSVDELRQRVAALEAERET